MARERTVAFGLCSLLLGACGADSPLRSADDGGAHESDASAPDAGADGDAMDASLDADVGEGGAAEADAGPPACDPIAQTGCLPGQKCTSVDGVPFCRPNGTFAEGQACARSGSHDDCEAGTICVRDTCSRICALDDTACDCVEVLDLFDAPGVGVCQETCDPIADDCNGQLACYVTISEAVCGEPGKLEAGDPCFDVNDCGPGLDCFLLFDDDDSPSCTLRCDASARESGCPEEHVCVSFNELLQNRDFAENVGACVNCELVPDAPGCQ